MHRHLFALAILLCCLPLQSSTAAGTETPEPMPAERRQLVERIREGELEMRQLHDRLRAMDKRAALASDAGESNDDELNWWPVDLTHPETGEAGVYTYLFYSGSRDDRTSVKALDELIEAIEALPASSAPAAISSRFVLPVKPGQSMMAVARRPYDFKLSHSYLSYLGLNGLPDGPVLVSLAERLDPFGMEMAPPFLAVVLGHDDRQAGKALLRVWHGYEKPPLPAGGHPLADLFWQLLDEAGPSRVTRDGGKLLIDLAPADSPVSRPQHPDQ